MLGLKSKAVYCSWMNLTMLKLFVQVRLTFYVWILLSDGFQAGPIDRKRRKLRIQTPPVCVNEESVHKCKNCHFSAQLLKPLIG